MTRVLIDTNVLVDLLTDDPEWSGWSSDAFCACRDPWSAAFLAGEA